MKYSTLVDAQTHQWVRPPGMIVGNKINIQGSFDVHDMIGVG
jgi:hypothetical protein